MATIEGNEIALRNVLDTIHPKPRDGSNAQGSNDNNGPPFFTADYHLLSNYSEQLAPSWVYGLTYEGPADSTNPSFPVLAPLDRIFVSWNVGNTTQETILFVGQTLFFPRGARRVFVRCPSSVPQAFVKLTWQTDVYAQKTSSPNTYTVGVNPGFGGSFSGLFADWLPFGVPANTQLYVAINNASSVPLTWRLVSNAGVILDSAVQAAGVVRNYHYGPGVSSPFPANTQGHGICLPGPLVQLIILPNAPLAPGDQLQVEYWFR